MKGMLVIFVVLLIGMVVFWQYFLTEQSTPDPNTGKNNTSSDTGNDPASQNPNRNNQNIPPNRIPSNIRSRVVIVRNSKIWGDKNTINQIQMQRMLSVALNELFLIDSSKEAFKKIITAQDKVGLKVNAYLGQKSNSTHPELAEAVSTLLIQAGVQENNIIIWDRAKNELEDAGYKINTSAEGKRCLATMTHRVERLAQPFMGYDDAVIAVGKSSTRLSSILTKFTTVTINMPVLRTHKFTANCGINNALQNMYHAIEITPRNTEALYANECDPGAAEVYGITEIKNKTKLVICDALTPLYDGGPMDDQRYHTNYNGIIMGIDPVAVDAVGQSVLQKIRDKKGGKEWPKLVTNYLITAEKNNLGISNLSRIQIIEKDLDY
ncbi:MAG: DUF362 domain-containing protein [Planctomycetes bacterium]|nr:DUF362 domain-containing protein [Planctomycetota bacterium]